MKLYYTRKACELMDLNYTTLIQYIKRGLIEFKRNKSNTRYMIPETEIDRWNQGEINVSGAFKRETDIENEVVDKLPKDIMVLKCIKKNWPDRVFFLPNGRTVFIEFKRPGEHPTENQKKNHRKLRKLGFPVYICTSVKQAFNILEKEQNE